MNFVNLKTFLDSAEELEDVVDVQITAKDKRSDLLHERSILDRLSGELKKSGFAGPTKIPELVFLSMYTGYLDQPVSLVIKGSSGVGKSFSMHAALNFIPNEAYEQFSGASEKAFIYMKDLDLKHRMLIIGEAAGMAKGDGRTFLRQLLSEHKVRYATVQKTSNGLEGGQLPALEGPTGLIMTTTATGLHHEDESRMISAQIQESEEQIRSTLRAQAKQSSGSSTYQIDYKPWHDLHKSVGEQSTEVSIPFANTLAEALPATDPRVQRDFPKVLSLITAHALMHFCTRERDRSGALVATLADYAVVHRLVADYLSQGIDVAVPDGVRQVVDAVRTLTASTTSWNPFGKAANPSSTSVTELTEHLDKNAGTVSRHVEQAIDKGFLVNNNSGQGKTAQIALGNCKMPMGHALPHPDELTEKSGS